MIIFLKEIEVPSFLLKSCILFYIGLVSSLKIECYYRYGQWLKWGLLRFRY